MYFFLVFASILNITCTNTTWHYIAGSVHWIILLINDTTQLLFSFLLCYNKKNCAHISKCCCRGPSKNVERRLHPISLLLLFFLLLKYRLRRKVFSQTYKPIFCIFTVSLEGNNVISMLVWFSKELEYLQQKYSKPSKVATWKPA